MRYHNLVKEHHPDRHGGDKDAEERLKIINEAHATLLRHLDGGARKAARYELLLSTSCPSGPLCLRVPETTSILPGPCAPIVPIPEPLISETDIYFPIATNYYTT